MRWSWKSSILGGLTIALSWPLLAHSAGQVVPFYGIARDATQQSILEKAREGRVSERLASMVNSTLRLKADLHVGIASCNSPNAFFDPSKRAIVLCTEMLQLISKTASEDPAFGSAVPETIVLKQINGVALGVFMHEVAHAVIHINQVLITGREEDVADQFSVWMATRFMDQPHANIVGPVVWFWGRMAKANNMQSMTPEERKSFMANEHSLDEQRVFNLACWAYGTGTEGGYRVAQRAGLPQERKLRCDKEWHQLNEAMKANFQSSFKTLPLNGRW